MILAALFVLNEPGQFFLLVAMWFAGGITLSMFSHKHLMEGMIFFGISAILLVVACLTLGIISHQ